MNNDRFVFFGLFLGFFFTAILLADYYLTEDGKMTTDEKTELISQELDLDEKYIQVNSDGTIDTINGEYYAEYSKDEKDGYFIKKIIKN